MPEDEAGKYRYYVGDDTGLAGIEKSMNVELKGKPGVRELLKNEKGVLLQGEVGYKEPQPWRTVYLTIDARMQYLVERILREAGVGRACAVIIKPTTGEVLAMASVPSYDPNRFIPSISQHDWDAYISNKTLPFQNRATAASPPGSTFKLVTALSAALAGEDKFDRKLLCDGGQGYGNSWMRCWISAQGGSHGWLNVSQAIKSSCNDFFYQQGNLAGIKNIVTVGRLLGLGDPTGVPLDGEGGGILPTPEWLRMYGNRQWGAADTAQVSIGQGAMSATPLQMCNVVATIANRGLCFKPRLVSRLVDADGDENAIPSELKADLTREGVTVDQIEKIRHGMWLVVNDGGGTGRRAYSATHPTAGKTGSATVPKIMIEGEEREDTHAWFVSFAPYEEPEIAVCVRVEGGKAGGKVAAPIAAEIIARVLSLADGYKLRMRPMPEAEGNFDFFDEITFGGDGGAFDDGEMDEATGLQEMIEQPVEVPDNEQSGSDPARPRIQSAVDEQGKVESSENPE